MTFKASIIIPTFHRKISLMRLLKSLSKQDLTGTEIIVVEQGDRNEKDVRRIEVELGLPLHYIFLSTPSMTHARNVGAKLAKGEFLLFIDDDCIPHLGFIRSHLKNFRDPHVAATVGRTLTPGQKIEPHNSYVGRISLLGKISGGFSSTIKQEVDTVIGCNMCWRKDIYQRLGGMDEQYTGNALREETDLSLRAKNIDYIVIFEPKAVVEHLRDVAGGARKTEGRMQWYFDFFSNETYFFLKHRPKILFPLFLLTKINWTLKCMFGFGREVSFRSIKTPLMGMINGIKKYRIWKSYVNRR